MGSFLPCTLHCNLLFYTASASASASAMKNEVEKRKDEQMKKNKMLWRIKCLGGREMKWRNVALVEFKKVEDCHCIYHSRLPKWRTGNSINRKPPHDIPFHPLINLQGKQTVVSGTTGKLLACRTGPFVHF